MNWLFLIVIMNWLFLIVIMRWYWPLRRRRQDYCQIIPLQRNIRGLIVRQNHVSSMTLRK